MAINTTTISSAALAALANGSEFITTSKLAKLLGFKDQTIRKHLCNKGHFYGLVPVMFGGPRWRVTDVDKLVIAGAM
jgi:predicted transcriptional regulator